MTNAAIDFRALDDAPASRAGALLALVGSAAAAHYMDTTATSSPA